MKIRPKQCEPVLRCHPEKWIKRLYPRVRLHHQGLSLAVCHQIHYGQLSTDVNTTVGICNAFDNPSSIASPMSLEKTPRLRYFKDSVSKFAYRSASQKNG